MIFSLNFTKKDKIPFLESFQNYSNRFKVFWGKKKVISRAKCLWQHFLPSRPILTWFTLDLHTSVCTSQSSEEESPLRAARTQPSFLPESWWCFNTQLLGFIYESAIGYICLKNVPSETLLKYQVILDNIFQYLIKKHLDTQIDSHSTSVTYTIKVCEKSR